MSVITTINAVDSISASRTVINTNFSNLNTDKIETSVLDTDTALTANSDSKVATQRAVKAYVDAGGNTNASETTRGISEEATDAEVTAGTATGGTGAKLFVTPAKLATRLTALLPTYPYVQQAIPTGTFAYSGGTSMSDGSAFFLLRNSGNTLERYGRDALTGFYFKTHSIDPTFTFDNQSGMIVIGIYLYIFGDDNTNLQSSRFLAADLTGETTMTVPVVGNINTTVGAWTDGTFAYVIANDSSTTSRKWSVSGTTFSAVTTATVASTLATDTPNFSFWDGTSAYIITNNSPTTVNIKKLTAIDGSSTSTTGKLLATIGGADTGAIGVPLNSGALYIGKISNNFNATVDVSSTIHLIPVTKP